jgi:hypothetical protein
MLYLRLLLLTSSLSYAPVGWAQVEKEFFGIPLWVIGLIGFLFFASYLYERRRSNELARVARRIGFTYVKKTQSTILSGNDFPVERKNGKVINLIKGERDNIEIEVFGYKFGSGDDTGRFTIGAYRCNSLRLPKFELTPKSIFTTPLWDLRGEYVDFVRHKKFSDAFLVKGDKSSLQKVFTYEIMKYLLTKPEMSVEGNENSLIIYYDNQRIKPDNLKSFMEDGLRLTQLFMLES